MADIIDLEFYRKFKVVLHIRGTAHRHLLNEKTRNPGYQTKSFRRKRKIDADPKITKKD